MAQLARDDAPPAGAALAARVVGEREVALLLVRARVRVKVGARVWVRVGVGVRVRRKAWYHSHTPRLGSSVSSRQCRAAAVAHPCGSSPSTPPPGVGLG